MENHVNPEIVMNKVCSRDSEHPGPPRISVMKSLINLEILIRFRQ